MERVVSISQSSSRAGLRKVFLVFCGTEQFQLPYYMDLSFLANDLVRKELRVLGLARDIGLHPSLFLFCPLLEMDSKSKNCLQAKTSPYLEPVIFG